MSASTPLTYDQAGVNYDLIDPLKVSAQRAAAATALNIAQHGFAEVKAVERLGIGDADRLPDLQAMQQIDHPLPDEQ